MKKFVEFEIEETKTEMKLYAKLEDGSLIHVRDYDYLYEGDYQFYSDANSTFVEVYCHDGVSYEISDGKLFESTFNNKDGGWVTEITLPMLVEYGDLIPASSHDRTIDRPVSPFAL